MPSNSMNVINYNRSQLPQRDKFKNVLGGYKSDRKTEYNLPKATTKQLKEMGKRLREERKVRMLKVIVLTFVLLLVFYCVLVYSMDGMIELLS
ncbi:hypothetical protein DFQ09_101244 [Winogradskyella pacifica]|uniref:Triple QxxK/R motif-containing protein n=1 Tax=Winogradskyella pacifica TaxID=664642 RepID=A0A3D9N5L9_9FLAO|nr:hypothetical protein [Winogradskyella pacifica]REE27413.1 hypothetical protein DFQ09_101244 [Winogradskyella pacifica]